MQAKSGGRSTQRSEEQARALEEALWNCRRALIQTVHAISAVVARRDQYTARHQERVAQLAVAIGCEMGLEAQRLEGLYLGALVHDVGKVAIPSEMLAKPGALTSEERALMNTHARVGAEIMANVDLPWPIKEIVGQHHERLDGSGYPDGLAADDILLEARVVAVADVFQSLCDDRPYRSALGIRAALEELESGAGVTFDADAVRALRSTASGPERTCAELWMRLASHAQAAIERVHV